MRNKTQLQQSALPAKKASTATLRLVVFTLVFLTAFLVSGKHSAAQEKWNLSVRTGINLPTKDLGVADLKTGFGFDGTIGYRIMPHLFLNAGWGWNRFASENEGKNDYEETGYILGFRFVHPISQSKWRYMAGVNAIYNHIEVENSNGTIIADTGHGWGWQADAGIGIPLGKRTQLVPSVRYRALSRDLKIGNAPTSPVDLNYFSGGLGLSWNF